MGKIKGKLIILGSITLVGLIGMGIILAQEISNPLAGKIIALDAGHGGEEFGAVNNQYNVVEKDVNLAVVYALRQKLEDPSVGAKVVLTRVCDETISNRKERVDWAVEQCKTIAGRKCDALVSVHHNGSTDPNHDGTMVIYNERQDLPLAEALLKQIWPLTGNNEGLDHGGYGMTVYDHLVSALTEAYYITNNGEAEQYLNGTLTKVCDNNGDGINDYSVLVGERVNQEADALYQGLYNYFNAPPTKTGRK